MTNDRRQKTMFSVKRVCLVVIPLAAIVVAGLLYTARQFRAEADTAGPTFTMGKFGLTRPTDNQLSDQFSDSDGDMVADAPTNDGDVADPDTLVFSHIGGAGEENQLENWQPLLDALAEATGKSVGFSKFESVDAQLAALCEGHVHVTVVNTGAVPRAVNRCGFVPLCTTADAAGNYGYRMQFIVPASSNIRRIEQVKGKRVTFTSTSSNSGFKAPVVILMRDFGMQPDRDYMYGFSTAHHESIARIASGELTVAPVASDVVQRMIDAEEIAADTIRVIFASEPFPPAAFGVVYNLKPSLTASIREALQSLTLTGTALEKIYGTNSTRLVAVSYRDDWQLIRNIDNTLGVVHEVPMAPLADPDDTLEWDGKDAESRDAVGLDADVANTDASDE